MIIEKPYFIVMTEIKLEPSWKKHLETEFARPYMQNLKSFLVEEKKKKALIYPSNAQIFAAFEATPFDKVKVVILGQDPYHGPGQAMGLSFSVRSGVRFPPSLQNIFKELHDDLGLPIPKSGDLTPWTKQGVLLLNSVLTVKESNAASHQGKGWEQFTDAAIGHLNDERKNIVFILWGSYAQKKGAFIDRKKHFVIETAHPSPLSAHRGFLGGKPFSKTNKYLESKGLAPINWAFS